MLELHSVSKSFAGVHALRDVTFDVAEGEIHALVGENGAGKSTLMNILSGIYTDYEGELSLNGAPVRFSSPRDAQSHGIAIIHQELNLIRDLSVAANMYLGREPRNPWLTINNRRMIRDSGLLLNALAVNVSPLARIADLRVGEQQLIEIATALSLDARILILDEPTSALSQAEIDRLFVVLRGLQSRGVTLIYVSHKFDEVFALADRISVLRDGRHVATHLTTETDQAELIREMVGRDLDDLFPKESTTIGPEVLRIENLTLRTPVGSVRRDLNDISFNVHAGEIVGLGGLMGSGRTETLESIYGALPLAWRRGQVTIHGESARIRTPRDAIARGIAFVTEDRKSQSLILGLPVGHNLTLTALRSMCIGGIVSAVHESRAVAASILSLQIRTPTANAEVEKLSGGNQQKVALGKCLMGKPQVLLLDEPTRGIDVGAKAEIYALVSALASRGAAIVIASSELPELLAMCDRIIVLCEGRISAVLDRESASQDAIMLAATRYSGQEGDTAA